MEVDGRISAVFFRVASSLAPGWGVTVFGADEVETAISSSLFAGAVDFSTIGAVIIDGGSFLWIVISTLRLRARPDSVRFEARGFSLPLPLTLRRDGSTPFLTR